jgi:drug/metabolite transporter (DMT)-like permease
VHPYIALGLAPLLWAGNLVVGKALADALPPFTLSAVRWAIGALVLLPFVLRRPGELRAPRELWPGLVVLGITGVTLYSALLYAALPHTATLNAALLQAAIPLVTLLLGVAFLRERPRWTGWLGVAVAFAGVAWIVGGGQLDALLALRLNRGDALMLVNVLLWAVYTIVAQRTLRRMTAVAGTFVTVAIGLVPLLPIAAFEMQSHTWPEPTLALLAALAYLGIFPSIVAYLLWNYGSVALGAGRAALFTNLLPLYTAVLAAVALGEPTQGYHLVGGVLVAAGVYLGTRPVLRSGPDERR